MENSENKKTLEELADEALDKVAGGRSDFGEVCSDCGRGNVPLWAGERDCPDGFTEGVYAICDVCKRSYTEPGWIWRQIR